MKSEAHLAFVRSLGCVICEAPAEAAHIRYADPRYGKPQAGTGQKPGDEWTVPLCANHHRLHDKAQHRMNERAFWKLHEIDATSLALHIWNNSGDVDGATWPFPAPIRPQHQGSYA